MVGKIIVIVDADTPEDVHKNMIGMFGDNYQTDLEGILSYDCEPDGTERVYINHSSQTNEDLGL